MVSKKPLISKRTQKYLLIAGGLGLTYILLRGTVQATGKALAPLTEFISAPAKAMPAFAAGIQAGAAELAGGTVGLIGAAGTGLVVGAAESIAEGVEEVTRPFPQPLRTYEPVPEVRHIPMPSPERLAYQEAIGIPLRTSEEYEAVQQAVTQGIISPLAAQITAPGYQAGLTKQLAAIAAAQAGGF